MADGEEEREEEKKRLEEEKERGEPDPWEPEQGGS